MEVGSPEWNGIMEYRERILQEMKAEGYKWKLYIKYGQVNREEVLNTFRPTKTILKSTILWKLTDWICQKLGI